MNTKPFDISEYLESDYDIRQFLEEAAATGDTADLIHALNIAARARGMSGNSTLRPFSGASVKS